MLRSLIRIASVSKPSRTLGHFTTLTPSKRFVSLTLAPSRSLSFSNFFKGDSQNKVITKEELQKLISQKEKKYTLIDVREPHELQITGKIDGAINIPLGTLQNSFSLSPKAWQDRFGVPKAPEDEPIIFYCRSGARAETARAFAESQGYTKTLNYKGSAIEWFKDTVDPNRYKGASTTVEDYFGKKSMKERIEVVLREEDLEESFTSGGGKGGQKVNKSQNCVILKHKPTGLFVKVHQERGLAINRKVARKLLLEKLDEHTNGELSKKALRIKKIQKKKAKQRRRTREKYSPEEPTTEQPEN